MSSVIVLLLKHNFCLRNIMSFFFVGIWHNLLFSYSLYTVVVNNVFREPYLLLINSSFTLRLSKSQGMLNLGLLSEAR